MTASAFVTAGCGRAGGGPDAGLDASDTIPPPLKVDVSGTAAIHPAAEAWMTDAGIPLPSLAGLTARAEEPFRLALQDSQAILGETAVAPNGGFAIPDVNTGLVTRGIAVGLADARDSGAAPFIPAATVVFDVKLHESLPQADITGARVWAIPFAYEEQLTAAVSPTRICELTTADGGCSAASLVEAGFMFGQIVDENGNPVTGAQIETDPPSWADRFFYPSDDLREVTQTSTHANGLFIFVHTGGVIEPFAFRVKDPLGGYRWWNGGG
ncbi:MAG TPA: hypothetical protein VE782_02855, partial [Myxococcaceae bacterium]|nr:hypothetical protein [Myxococcaceae bacterium]